MVKDPIVEKERLDRMHLVRNLAQRIHKNQDGIRRNVEAIDRAQAENRALALELESDRVELCDQARKLGIGPTRLDGHLVDSLVGLLVELPMRGQAPASSIPMPLRPPYAE